MSDIPDIKLLPGDIVFVYGGGIMSRLIRAATREWGEAPSVINHVGIITSPGGIFSAKVTEALGVVKTHRLWSAYDPRYTEIAIYRKSGLTLLERETVAFLARMKDGERYGYGKILLHAADALFGGAGLFRRLASDESRPICSWLVADAYAGIGVSFGVDSRIAQPDDIWDHVVSDQDGYQMVKALGPVYEGSYEEKNGQ